MMPVLAERNGLGLYLFFAIFRDRHAPSGVGYKFIKFV